MAVTRGIAGAFAFFVASFALHVVGGATGSGWLFAIAVALIYLAAAGFPAIAMALSGAKAGSASRRAAFIAGIPAGVGLTAAALWAANDRAFAWWHGIAAPGLVAVTTGLFLGLGTRLKRVGSPRRAGPPA